MRSLAMAWGRAAVAWFKVATELEEKHGRLVPWRERKDVLRATEAMRLALAIEGLEPKTAATARIKSRLAQALNQPTPTPKKHRPLTCSKCGKPGHNRSRCREVTNLTPELSEAEQDRLLAEELPIRPTYPRTKPRPRGER